MNLEKKLDDVIHALQNYVNAQVNILTEYNNGDKSADFVIADMYEALFSLFNELGQAGI